MPKKRRTEVEESLFKKIYDIAIQAEGADADLQQRLDEQLSELGVDKIFSHIYNPLSRLAEEGKVKAVKFILSDPMRIIDVNQALKGAVKGGQTDLVKVLIENYNANPSVIAKYAGRAGKENIIEDLASKSTDRHQKNEIYNRAVLGAAQGKQEQLVFALLGKGADKLNAIEGAGKGNDESLVEKLLEQYKDDTPNMLKAAVKGAASKGHIILLKKLLDPVVDKELAKELVNIAASSAMAAGYPGIVNEMVRRGRGDKSVLQAAVEGANRRGYVVNQANILEHIIPIDDINLRKNLATNAIKKNRSEDVINLDELLKDATKKNEELKTNSPALRAWYSVGTKLFNEGKLPFDIFIHIASYIAELSNLKIKNHYDSLGGQKFFSKTFQSQPKPQPDLDKKQTEQPYQGPK